MHAHMHVHACQSFFFFVVFSVCIPSRPNQSKTLFFYFPILSFSSFNLLPRPAPPPLPADVIEKQLLTYVLVAATDDVANVRVASSRCLMEIIPRLDKKLVQSKIKPALVKMTADADDDVAYFATQALQLCN